MSELDEAWALALAEAEKRARLAGRNDLADYLALRNSNDLLRSTGIDWLLRTFTELAGSENRAGSAIQMTTTEDHRFHVASATMVGQLLTLGNGVRRLFVEAGWPRTPRDGFVRGGGLACANLRHLGIKSASKSLLLLKSSTGAPLWRIVGEREEELNESKIRHHLRILLDRKKE